MSVIFTGFERQVYIYIYFLDQNTFRADKCVLGPEFNTSNVFLANDNVLDLDFKTQNMFKSDAILLREISLNMFGVCKMHVLAVTLLRTYSSLLLVNNLEKQGSVQNRKPIC